MSAFVPPQGGGSPTPAQGPLQTGKPGGRKKTGAAGFADALRSLVPGGKELRRKERSGKTLRKSGPAPAGAETVPIVPFDRAMPAGRPPEAPFPKKTDRISVPIGSGTERTEPSRGNAGKPSRARSSDRSREGAAARGTLPRSAPQDPPPAIFSGKEAAPDGIPPAPDPLRKPPSGKNGVAREEQRHYEAGPVPGGAAHAAQPEGKEIPGPAIGSPRAAAGRRSVHGERVGGRPAGHGDPAEGRSFPELVSASSGPVPGDQAAGAPSASAPTAQPAEVPQPSPLFEQVAMKMTPLADGAHDVEIRLTPEHLGKLKIELHIDSGRMDASVRADNSEARALLLREEPALREALRNAGVTLSSFNVALSGDPWGGRKGAARPDRDADAPVRKGRRGSPVEAAPPVSGDVAERGRMNRSEHWIA